MAMPGRTCPVTAVLNGLHSCTENAARVVRAGRNLPATCEEMGSGHWMGVLPANRFRAARFAQALLADLPLDQSDSGIECGFYIQISRIKQQGIVSNDHRCVGAARVTRIPGFDRFKYAVISDGFATAF